MGVLFFGRESGCFVVQHTDSGSGYTGDDIVGVLDFLIDGVFVMFGERVFRQAVGVPVGAGCAPLLAGLFLCSYEAEFIQSLLRSDRGTVAGSFGFTCGCVGGVLSLGGPKFGGCLGVICPAGLEVGGTAGSIGSASCLGLQLECDVQGRLDLRLCGGRGGFGFPVVGFPFLGGDIPASPACGVCVSRLMRYAGASSEYRSFLHRGKLLTNKLLTQGYCKPRLIKTIKKFYGRHHDIVDKFGVSVSKMILDILETQWFQVWFSFACFVTFTWRVSVLSQEALTLPEHPASLPIGSSRVTRFCHINVPRIYAYGIPLRYCCT